MPDKSSVPTFDQCGACALASQRGSTSVRLPTSHGEVCCLYKFQREGHLKLCLKEKQKGTGTCGGVCENCQSRLKFSKHIQDQALPALPSPSSSDTEQGRAPDSGKKGVWKIVARRRSGFKKLTIEVRPPKFKRKLWFGTFEPEDVERARDAIIYYVGCNLQYYYPDSPSIFEKHRLDIQYRDLNPSCEQFVQVGEKKLRASGLFARRVKDVIHTVTGKKRPSQGRPRSNGKNGVRKAPTRGPIVSCATGVPPSPGGSAIAWEETSNVAAAAAVPCSASFSGVISQRASTVNMPACEIFSSPSGSREDEILSTSFVCQEDDFDLEPILPDSWYDLDRSNNDGEGEPGVMEYNWSDFSSPLWNMNEGSTFWQESVMILGKYS